MSWIAPKTDLWKLQLGAGHNTVSKTFLIKVRNSISFFTACKKVFRYFRDYKNSNSEKSTSRLNGLYSNLLLLPLVRARKKPNSVQSVVLLYRYGGNSHCAVREIYKSLCLCWPMQARNTWFALLEVGCIFQSPQRHLISVESNTKIRTSSRIGIRSGANNVAGVGRSENPSNYID